MTAPILTGTVHGAWTDGAKHGSGNVHLGYSVDDPGVVRVGLPALGFALFVDLDVLDVGSQSYTAHGTDPAVWSTALRLHMRFVYVGWTVVLSRRPVRLFLAEADDMFTAALDAWRTEVTS